MAATSWPATAPSAASRCTTLTAAQPRSAVCTDSGRAHRFPEWSPDGREIVATRAQASSQPAQPYSASDGQLVVLGFSGGQLSPPEVLLQEPAQVHAHPSWSPDAWIVFVSSPVGGESRKHPHPLAPGPPPRRSRHRPHERHGRPAGPRHHVPAVRAQRAAGLPADVHHLPLAHGLRAPPPQQHGPRGRLAPAVDVGRGPDPLHRSLHAAVWLPFQDINQKNLLPTWSAQVPCTANTCGPNATCQSGEAPPASTDPPGGGVWSKRGPS